MQTLVSNTREGLIKLIERHHPNRTAEIFLFPAGSGTWRGVVESSLRTNQKIDGVLYPDGHYKKVAIRKINGIIKMQEGTKWVAWKQ